MRPKKILIYSPNTGGHRQVYCNVVTHWALESKMDVILCIGNDRVRSKNTSNQDSPYINMYRKNKNVNIINLTKKPPLKSNSEYLLDLENDLEPDLIFVISGDEFNHSLYSLVKHLILPKTHSSKWIGIFIACYFYPDSANWLKQKVQKFILKQKVKHFNVTYWLDEYFVNSTDIKNAFWLPDISKSFNVITNHEDTESELLCSKIDNFLINNEKREVLLFFGRDFNRKGFDFLVELALDDDRFVVLRAGDSLDSDENQELMDKMITLENDGRLLNIAKFIESSMIVEKLFRVTNFIPLPYRNHYSSSGVMLQSIEFQKPVIVPNIGLMGKRVIDNNIGITYKHKDYNDFKKAVYKMQNEYHHHAQNLETFNKSFSKERIFESLYFMQENNSYK
jgi:glycosyltransferase involved in cell wall biosynthesis